MIADVTPELPKGPRMTYCERRGEDGPRFYTQAHCECGSSLGCGEWQLDEDEAFRLAMANLKEHKAKHHG